MNFTALWTLIIRELIRTLKVINQVIWPPIITTLLYVLEAAAEHRKSVWVLDRPNPAGRPIEGLTLRPGWESFVGAGPLPMRHGLTLGELGRWFVDHFKLDVEYRVIEMEGWRPEEAPGFGWPPERVWPRSLITESTRSQGIMPLSQYENWRK